MTVTAIIAIPRPTPVMAVRFEGGFESYDEVSKWIQSQPKTDTAFPSCGFSIWYGGFGPGGRFVLFTTNGEMEVDPGDYVIRDIRGEYIPCKPEKFNRNYVEQNVFTGKDSDNDERTGNAVTDITYVGRAKHCKGFVRIG